MREEKLRGCTCDECTSACENTPGWFKPREAEKAARLLGVPFVDFFKKFLVIDDFALGRNDILVLSPTIKGATSGEYRDPDMHGQCVFLQEGRCSIHAAKPFECKASIHGRQKHGRPRKAVANAWKKRRTKYRAELWALVERE